MPKLPPKSKLNDMEFSTEAKPAWEVWLHGLGEEGKRYAELVSPAFFAHLDPEMDFEAMKEAYLDALLNEVAVTANFNPQTGELNVHWQGNEEMILHELAQGRGAELSLEEIQAKIPVH
jgi:predicted esterase